MSMTKLLTYLTLIGCMSLIITVQAIPNLDIYKLQEKPHKGIKINVGQSFLNCINPKQSLGDFNGDGIDDIVIMRQTSAGDIPSIFVVYGNKYGITQPNFDGALTGTQFFKITSERVIVQATMMGDFNGDKIDDLLLGTTTETYVIFGRRIPMAYLQLSSMEFLPKNIGFKITSSPIGGDSEFRYPPDCAPMTSANLNGDDYDDIILGFKNDGFLERAKSGIVYVIFGTMNIMNDIDLTNGFSGYQGLKIIGAQGDDRFGAAISSIGDFNGDQVDDIIIGVYQADPIGRINAGTAYVIFGRKDGLLSNEIDLNTGLFMPNGFEIYGKEANNFSFQRVSGVGDINGDDKDDIIVTSGPEYDKMAYVIFGTEFPLNNIDLKIFQTYNNIGFEIRNEGASIMSGEFMLGAGDMNGDGIDDFMITSVNNQNNRRKLFVIYGNKTPYPVTTIQSADFTSSKGFMIFDSETSSLGTLGVWTGLSKGDVNGDGKPDLVLITGEDVYVLHPQKRPLCATGNTQVCKVKTL